MRVRQLSIKNFRGIKTLDWTLPIDQRLITLIGPGDCGKSTILDAIHCCLAIGEASRSRTSTSIESIR